MAWWKNAHRKRRTMFNNLLGVHGGQPCLKHILRITFRNTMRIYAHVYSTGTYKIIQKLNKPLTVYPASLWGEILDS